MSVLLEFSMSPFDRGESLSKYVSRSLDIIDRSGIPYVLGPMGTVLEGECEVRSAKCERTHSTLSVSAGPSPRRNCRGLTVDR